MSDKNNKFMQWKALKAANKDKRCGKTNIAHKKVGEKRGYICVQRLSNKVSGKQQKYQRIGATEFVRYPFEHFSLENIKCSCEMHFEKKLGKKVKCDVLASERGPSCFEASQLPNFQLINIRILPTTCDVDDFEDLDNASVGNSGEASNRSFLKPLSVSIGTATVPLSIKRKHNPNNYTVTKSRFGGSKKVVADSFKLTPSKMLKLGQSIGTALAAVDLNCFDIGKMQWSSSVNRVYFDMKSEAFGKGAFREAYKATSEHPQFQNKEWVIKRYIDPQNDILAVGESIFHHAQKQVQAHKLAWKIAVDLADTITDKVSFGPTLKFNEVYLGTLEGETVTVEEFVDGNFKKYINNDGKILIVEANDDISKKAECYSHFSYVKSEGELIVLDIQGCGYTMFDPEVASSLRFCEENTLFCVGNLYEKAIEEFLTSHICNKFCKLLNLPQWNEE